MRIKSQFLFLVILIALVSFSCKKSDSEPTSANKRAIVGYLDLPNTLVGKWVSKSHKSFPLYDNNINYHLTLLGKFGKDTVECVNNFKQYFDSISFNRDSTFYGYFNTGYPFAMSGQWNVSDSILTFYNAQITSLTNNETYPGVFSIYWYFNEKEGKTLALTTPVLCVITWEGCEADISFEKDESNYIKIRE